MDNKRLSERIKKLEEQVRGLREEKKKIKLLFEEAERRATHDGLTNLYNRRGLQEILEREKKRAERHNYPIGFLLVDLNDFKGINDVFGHQTGDKALTAVADLLRKSVRGSDVVVRYGGDEFLIVCPELQDLTPIKDRILLSLKDWDEGNSFLLSFPLSLAIGENVWWPGKDKTVEQAIHEADLAMYQNKNKVRKGGTRKGMVNTPL